MASESQSPGAGRVILSASVVLAALMQALDSTIANVALPHMGGDLAAAADQLNWVLTAYIVAAAMATPVTGWLERRLGRRRLFVGAVFGFIGASMLCGIATSMGQMVVFRGLQGLFGAPLVPLAQAVLIASAPEEKRGQAMALFGMGIMLGPIIGPALGGWLTDTYGWRWVFYVNVPIGLLAAVGLWTHLPADDVSDCGPLDWAGLAYLWLAIASLQLFLDRGQQLNWLASVEIQIELGLAILGAYLYLGHTLTAPRPLIAAAVFRDRNLAPGLLLMFTVGAILLATLALLSPYIERLMGYPIQTAGLVLAPRGIGTMIAMVMVGRLADRMDARILLTVGLGVTSFALYEMTGFTPAVSETTLIRTGLVQGFGLGFVFVPLSTLAFATISPSLRTDGTALLSLLRNLGSSVGISVTGYLLSRDATVAYAALAEKLSPFSFGLAISRDMVRLGTPKGAAQADLLLQSQAQAIAYVNVFWLMTVVTLAVIPLVWLLRPVERGDRHIVEE